MFTKRLSLVVACLATAIQASVPAYAAKIPLSDDMIAEVSGSANDYTLTGNSNTTGTLASGANVNSQPHSDLNTSDQSQNKVTNNQSGPGSQVQQNISGLNNALVVGSVSQNVIINFGGTSKDTINVTGYAMVTSGLY